MLEKSIKRNIEELLNQRTVPDFHLPKNYPEAARSVINFGIPNYASLIRSNRSIRQVSEMIRQTILTFEPRIKPRTLEIIPMVEMELQDTRFNELSADYKRKIHPNGAFEFIIRGDICSTDSTIDFQTKINIADGKAIINK